MKSAQLRLAIRNVVGRILGLRPGEFQETWDIALFIPIGLCAVVMSAVLALWPLQREELRNLVLLCLVALILFAFVKDKRSCAVGVLFLLALKWAVAAILLSSYWSGLIALAHVILALLIARRGARARVVASGPKDTP